MTDRRASGPDNLAYRMSVIVRTINSEFGFPATVHAVVHAVVETMPGLCAPR